LHQILFGVIFSTKYLVETMYYNDEFLSDLDIFDLTSIEHVEYYMRKFTKKFPQIEREILWTLFLNYQGDTKKITKHLKEMLQKPKGPSFSIVSFFRKVCRNFRNRKTHNYMPISTVEQPDYVWDNQDESVYI